MMPSPQHFAFQDVHALATTAPGLHLACLAAGIHSRDRLTITLPPDLATQLPPECRAAPAPPPPMRREAAAGIADARAPGCLKCGPSPRIADAPRKWWLKWLPLRLGDAIASIAQPIARVLDAVMGTNLQNCEACHRRRARLNRL